MEAARTSSGSGTRHRRCRCCLPALTGFTTSRRGEADASHHGRARDGSQHDVKTGEKPAPRRAGTRSYHNELGANSVRRRARVAVRDASILRPAMTDGVHRRPGQETRRGGRCGMRGRSAIGSNGAMREARADVRVPRDCVGWTQAMHGVDSRAAVYQHNSSTAANILVSLAIFQSRGRRGEETPTPLNMALACDN